MSKLAPFEELPLRVRRRRSRTKPLHPEALHDLIRARVRSASKIPKSGWRPSYGFLICFYKRDVRRTLWAPTYEDAVRTRDEEEGDYEKAWIIMLTGDRM